MEHEESLARRNKTKFAVNIVRLRDIPAGKCEALLDQAAAVFFETSLTKRFESDEARHAFFMRWFGNYAAAEPESMLFALTGDDEAAGYLAGCTDSFSERAGGIVNGIDYFTPPYRAALYRYPSHFHINVKPSYQGSGIGHALVARFCSLCANGGSPGVHAATGAASPAVAFYRSCGFARLERLEAISPKLAVMVRPLP